MGVPILGLVARCGGGGGQGHAPTALPWGKRPGTRCAGVWLGPRTALEKRKFLTPTGVLCRLRYSGPQFCFAGVQAI
jgi:hypothetical protein